MSTWARIASFAPALVNAVARAPGLRRLATAAAGIAPQRQLPAFAPQTFRDWFRQRPARAGDGPRVLLWPDTFNDHFHPATLKAAVDVLEASGFQVGIPGSPLCCGRPLYDQGMLKLARRRLGDVMAALAPEIDNGVPIVALEPSCASVFRDELAALFPENARARRLQQQTMTLAEFLEKRAALPKIALDARVLLHGHCHQKALMGMRAERALLDTAGVAYTVLDSGCCGMAGAFGFERDHYDVATAIGERVLLPAVRAADAETVVVTDGFSCREQIAQSTGRRALHLAELLHGAIFGAQPRESGGRIEDGFAVDAAPDGRAHRSAAAALIVASAVAVAFWVMRRPGRATRVRSPRRSAFGGATVTR